MHRAVEEPKRSAGGELQRRLPVQSFVIVCVDVAGEHYRCTARVTGQAEDRIELACVGRQRVPAVVQPGVGVTLVPLLGSHRATAGTVLAATDSSMEVALTEV